MQLIRLLVAGLVPALRSFAGIWGMSVGEFEALNPGVTCPSLDPTELYCVMGTVIVDPPGYDPDDHHHDQDYDQDYEQYYPASDDDDDDEDNNHDKRADRSNLHYAGHGQQLR
ncbi:hypothetical protein FE257_001017 [Aspergillus nanangensis]|uniref:LysM domain-containing protein n=1 Tax=Aspergillus nanangensis TaxID=2582783 RepID=A0AAD4GXE1_ASPNN|nr:hypothetical protein FE257_001017 [Aspergillus nanangensis]